MGMAAHIAMNMGQRRMPIKRTQFRGWVSVLFVLASALAIFATGRTGLVFKVAPDGTLEYYRDIPASMSGQDEYLAFVITLIPSAFLRLFRFAQRPWLFEVALFVGVFVILLVAVNNVGIETISLTAMHEPWFVLVLAAVSLSVVLFFALVIEGWGLPRVRAA